MKYLIVCLIILTSCSNRLKNVVLNSEYGHKVGHVRLNYNDTTFYFTWLDNHKDSYFAKGTFFTKGDTIILKSSRGCSCVYEISHDLGSSILVKSNSRSIKTVWVGSRDYMFVSQDSTIITNTPIDTIHISHLVKNGKASLYSWALPAKYYNVVIQCNFPQDATEVGLKSRKLLMVGKNTYRDLH